MQEQGIDTIVRQVASAPLLLIACDFDGTIAPIVNDPGSSVADPVAVDALRRMAWMPRTRSAIVSGRDLADLRRRFPVSDGLMLVGSHGAEILGEPVVPLPESAIRALSLASAALETIARNHRGAWVQIKPRGVAFHYRQVDVAEVAKCVEAVVGLQSAHSSLKLRLGSMVVEFVADRATKADAVRYLRDHSRASAVMFVGDDLADEDAFGAMLPSDAGVKVGAADSRASHRVRDISAVRTLLCQLADARAAWLKARRSSPDDGGLAN